MSNAAGGVQSSPGQKITREAARDLSSYQYCAMLINSAGRVDYCNNSGVPIGILQNKPSAVGQEAEVAITGTSLAKVDGNAGTITAGSSYLGADTTYDLIAVSADDAHYFALALETSTADGDYIEVQLLGTSYISAAGDD